MNKKAIVLGNDHTNSVGVVQSLGIEGFCVTVFVWGVKTGLLLSSRYTSALYSSVDAQGCIDRMLEVFSNENEPIPIIACCDAAAVVLEKNVNRLKGRFLFESVGADFTLVQLQHKDIQIRLAQKSGFVVPKSIEIVQGEEIDKKLLFDAPFLIKPLMSTEGAKSDIIVCKDINELKEKASIVLSHTPRILLQQYIEKDYELSIIGCAKKDGSVLIPAKEIKLTLFPPQTGLESKAMMAELTEESIIVAINKMIKTIGYIGTFSVELMHNKNDDMLYFTEINLRNDGAQPFVRKYGYNLPLIHINDLLGRTIEMCYDPKPGLYLWEMHHFLAFRQHHISFMSWIIEMIKAKGFLLTCKHDKRPFFKQFDNKIRSALRRKNKTAVYYK